MISLGWIVSVFIFACVISWLVLREPRRSRRDLGTLSPHWRGTALLEDELHRSRRERE